MKNKTTHQATKSTHEISKMIFEVIGMWAIMMTLVFGRVHHFSKHSSYSAIRKLMQLHE